MDAKRLEELARLTQYCVDDNEIAIETYLSAEDLRDLARCAAAWAKVERAITRTGSNVELTGYPTSRGSAWWYTDDTLYGRQSLDNTAIEAVEAAKEEK